MKKTALFISTALLFAMAGCKNNDKMPEKIKIGETSSDYNTIITVDNPDIVRHIVENVKLPEKIKRITDINVTASGRIIVTAVDENGKILFYSSNSDMSVLNEIAFNDDYNVNDMDKKFCYTYLDDGTIYLLETNITHNGIEMPSEDDAEFDFEEYQAAAEAEYSLCRYNTMGKRDLKKRIENASDYLDMGVYAGIDDMIFDGEQFLFLSGGRIYSMTVDGEITAEINMSENEFVTQIIYDSDENICCVIEDTERTYICTVNSENMTLNNDTVVLADEISGRLSKGNDEYRFFAESKSKFYGITRDNKAIVLVDFVKSGLSTSLSSVVNTGSGFAAVENNALVYITENQSAESSEVITVKIGCLAQMYELEDMAAKFNRSSSKYRIEIDSYGRDLAEGNIPDEDFEKLKLDVISGKGPDILICSDAELMQNLASKGAFADLYEFMKNDNEINCNTLMPNIIEAYDMNGSLYMLPDRFSIKSCVAKSKFVKTENWTLEDMKNLYYEHKEDKDLLLHANNGIAVFSFGSASGEVFIDRKNNTCNFNSVEFKNFLEFCKEFPSVEEDLAMSKVPEGMPDALVCTRDYALLNELYMNTLRDYSKMKWFYYGGEELTLVGAPSAYGRGAAILSVREAAILNSCKNKQAAWNAFKIFFEANYQIYSDNGLSPVTAYFEKAADLAMMDPGYLAEDGSYNTYTYKCHVDGVGDLIVYPLTQEERDKLCDYVKKVNVRSCHYTSSQKIINEELKAYLDGRISVDEAAENIQQRMEIYLSEKS